MSNYNQGKVDAIQMWGSTCGKQSGCEDCLIGQVKGDAVSCQEFAAQFPAKFLSLLTEMSNKDFTYFDEYNIRFPQSNLSVEALSEVACRKAIFEGFTGCEGGDCEACWKQAYVGDTTEVDSNTENN